MDNLQDDLDKKRRTYELVNSDTWTHIKDRFAEQMIARFSKPYTGTFEEKGMQLTVNQSTEEVIREVLASFEIEAEQYVLDKKALEDDKPGMVVRF